MVLSQDQANNIVTLWFKYWNEGSLEKYLTLFSSEASLKSNLVKDIFPDSNGVIKGIHILAKYWDFIKEKYPSFIFTLLNFEIAGNKIIVYYKFTHSEKKIIASLTVNRHSLIERVDISYV